MGTLILHAGMSKTGSSSIQRWLAAQAHSLSDEHGVRVLTVRAGAESQQPEIAAYSSGSTRSGTFVGWQGAAGVRALCEQLDRQLETYKSVLITNEAFAVWFNRPRRGVLEALNELAAMHDVRVAYYVRPQHTSLEAAWKQWGFREGMPPSEYLGRRLDILHYLATVERVNSAAPRLSFIVRPFRADLLDGGDVVTDFAKVILGAEAVRPLPYEIWANRGLPFELVNLLRYAPLGHFWSSPDDNVKLDRLRSLISRWSLPESQKVLKSRNILQAFCHHEFEPENRRLIERLRWPTDYFVPPPPERPEHQQVDLAMLDDLWNPAASEEERGLLFHALSDLLDVSRQLEESEQKDATVEQTHGFPRLAAADRLKAALSARWRSSRSGPRQISTRDTRAADRRDHMAPRSEPH